MATLIAETAWKTGILHDDTVYHSTVDNGPITNVYTGKSEPDYDHYVTSIPLSALTPQASIVTPGPDLLVVGDLNGLWPNGAQLSIAITVTGGTNIVTTITQTAVPTLSSEDAAVRVANNLNANFGTEILAAHTGQGNVTISALSPVTGLTITTWAVV